MIAYSQDMYYNNNEPTPSFTGLGIVFLIALIVYLTYIIIC